MLPYAAYLRVYQPISAYPPRTRAYWLAYARSPHRPRRINAVTAEHTESLRRALATPVRIAPREESTHAYVRKWRTRIYVCPWQTRLRSWIAFRDFRRATPRGLLSAFLPASSAAEAHAGLDDWAAQGESSTAQILTSRWSIPVAWFALFSDEERSLSLPEAPSGQAAGDTLRPDTPRALLYVTDMGTARLRAAAAVAVAEGGEADGPFLGGGSVWSLRTARRVEEWLHQWHPESLVELDYAGLVGLFGDEELQGDHSAAEAATAVEGLRRGEPEVSTAMYQRLRRRWRAVQALEHAN